LEQVSEFFPPGEQRLIAVSGAVGSFFERDSKAVDRLLSEMPPGAERDAAIRGIAVSPLLYRDSAQAAARALEIGDAETRRAVLARVVPFWLGTNPDAARDWLASAPGIPAEWAHEWTTRAQRR
jgi:hypothetical protein